MSSTPPRVELEEARARLRELGYLHGRVERFFFRRALEGRGGLIIPAILIGALCAAVASVAAVEAVEVGWGGEVTSPVLLAIHLAAANLLPSAVLGWLAGVIADRSRQPGGAAAAVGIVATAFVFLLFVAGTYSLSPRPPASSFLWAVPAGAAALLAGLTARSAVLARAYAQRRSLPGRPGGRAALLTALLFAAFAAVLLLPRRQGVPVPPPPLPSPREHPVVVIAIDGLSLDDPREGAPAAPIRALLAGGATGWWPARSASPPEIWTDIATGVSAERHGVRALARVRPAGSRLGLRPPAGSRWYLRRVGPALGLVASEPVSASERRSLAFWEVAASAGLPSAAVGWWASGEWPGAAVVDNRELLRAASDGLDVDARALAAFEPLASRPVAAVYLPGADILRDDPENRRQALDRLTGLLTRFVARASGGHLVLVVLAVDSHPRPGALGRAVVFDSIAARSIRIRPEDLAPSLLARAGIPAARDLAGRPVPALFRAGSLETLAVATYGERVVPEVARPRESDREYLEKLKSLGYLD